MVDYYSRYNCSDFTYMNLRLMIRMPDLASHTSFICTLLLGKCRYLPELRTVANSRKKRIVPTKFACSILYQSHNALLCPERSPSFDISIYATAPDVDVSYRSIPSNDTKGLTDADLYNFLQHKIHTITTYQGNRCALQIEVPKLAFQSRLVFHSLPAVSAACLCHDMTRRACSRHEEI